MSELLAWPTQHLGDAADYWAATGNGWYEVFNQIWRDSLSVDWEGNGADALRARTYADNTKVSELVDLLHDAAATARAGASDLYAARSRVRYAVEDAREAGFDVNEDLSVTDTRTRSTAIEQAARQAQTQAFADDIRERAVQLVGLDQQVAGRVNGAMAGIGNIFPADKPTTTTTSPPPPPPKCDPVDISDLMRKVQEWNDRDAALTTKISAYNREGETTAFNMNDPEGRRQWADYLRRGRELQALKDELVHDQTDLIQEVTECGGKVVDTHIVWPDGSTTPTPTPTR